MNSKTLKIIMISSVISGAFTNPAYAEQGGFFKSLSQSTAQRVEQAATSTEHRLLHSGDAVARHLERQPEDVKHLDDITALVALDTVRSVEQGARAVVGGVVADSVRSVFGMFRNAGK